MLVTASTRSTRYLTQFFHFVRDRSALYASAGPKFGRRGGDGPAAETRFNDPDEFFFVCLGSGCVQHDLPRVQEVNTVAHLEDLVIVVHDQNDRDAALATQILDQA